MTKSERFDYVTDDEFDATESGMVDRALELFLESHAGEMAMTGHASDEYSGIVTQVVLFKHKGRTYALTQRRVKDGDGWEWRRVVAEVAHAKK